MLDAHEVACVRLALATRDEDRLGRAADALREVAHGRDVAVVIEAHVRMVERHGLDGVHLTDAARSVRKVRADLGAMPSWGLLRGLAARRDDGGGDRGGLRELRPGRATALGTGEPAPFELFEWWSEMIEVPVVAEGALDEDRPRPFARRGFLRNRRGGLARGRSRRRAWAG
jgi:thiamine-phosphate pyrophosphorylase